MALKDVPSDLVERCQRGDSPAFDQLFAMIRDDMFRWIYSMLRDEDETEEVLQECCVRIFRHLPRLKDSARFGPWASRMIVNQVNTRRVKARRTRLEHLEEAVEVENDALPIQGSAGSVNPRSAAARSEILEHVNRAIAELPPRQRTAVMLFDVQGWSIRQIAEELECSEGAVKFNMFQGRRKLRELLGQYVDGAGHLAMNQAE